MSKFGNFFKFLQKPSKKRLDTFTSEGVKMNVKGQRVFERESPMSRIKFEDEKFLEETDSNRHLPNMLGQNIRFKVWMALFGVGLYFYLCYRLIIFRLKSDDLDLMEREVNEDMNVKNKIKNLKK